MEDVAEYVRTLARARSRSASQDWAEAAALWKTVVEANPVHGNHWDQLAEARFEFGDFEGALAAYEQVATLGVSGQRDTALPSEVAYQVARCRARLGDAEGAYAALSNAIDLGLRDLDRITDDEHLRRDDRYTLLAQPAVAECTRDEGWRIDVRFFAREVKRRAYAPFRHNSESHFDTVIERLCETVDHLSDAQLIVELSRLVRTLCDGHAYVEAPADRMDLHRALPVQFDLFDEGLFVTATAPEHREFLGAQVLEFDGTHTDRVLAEVDGIIARDNPHGPLGVVRSKLRRTAILHALGVAKEPDAVTLTTRSMDGRSADATLLAQSLPVGWRRARPCPPGWSFLPATLSQPLPQYLRNCGVNYWFEHQRADDLTYFQFNSVADDPIEPLNAFASRLFHHLATEEVGRLVIDLRWNGGGDTYLTASLLHQMISYQGALFVIIGRHTFSAAQNLCTSIAHHTAALFVGEPTGSSPNFVGETVPFQLPYSRCEVNVSDLYWQSSWPTDHRTWQPPDLYAPPTFAAYTENRDPAMEAILAYPREHLPGR